MGFLDDLFRISPEAQASMDAMKAKRDAEEAQVAADRAAAFNAKYPNGYKPAPGSAFAPSIAAVPVPQVEEAPNAPRDGGYTPAPPPAPEMSVGEPAKAPPPAPAPRGAAPIRMPEMDITARAPVQNAPAAPPAPAPAPAAAKPAGPSVDDEFARAQAEANGRSGGVGAGLLNFLSGFSSHGEELRKGIAEQSGKPVADLLARREAARKSVADKDAEFDAQRKTLLDDVASPLSKQSQMIMISAGVDPQVAMSLPASSLASVMSAKHMGLEAMNQAALREQGKLEIASREKVASANNATQVHVANIAADARQGAGGLKNTSEMTAVPGTEIAPGYRLGNVPIKGQEAADFRKAVASSDSLKQASHRLNELLAKHGTETLNTDAKREMDELVSSMQIAIKDMANLGAISKTDMDIILGQIPDTTTLTPEWFANNRGTLKALDKDISNKLSAKAQSLGLAGGSPAQGAQSSGPNGPTVVQNGHTYNWNPATGQYE